MFVFILLLYVVLSDVVNGGETADIIKARLEQNKIPGMLICGREDQVSP